MVQAKADDALGQQVCLYHIQAAKRDGLPALIVRNTFIDIEDAPTRIEVERSSSAPAAHFQSVIIVNTDAGNHSELLEHDDSPIRSGRSVASGSACDELVTTEEAVELETTELARTSTYDGYDSSSDICPVELFRTRTYDPYEHGCNELQSWSMSAETCASPEMMIADTPLALETTENNFSKAAACIMDHTPATRRSAGLLASCIKEDVCSTPCKEAPRVAKVSSVLQQQPQTLTRNVMPGTGIISISWCVDSKKLKSNDRVAVSPPFEICGVAPFKLMINALTSSSEKGGTSFKKSGGWGMIQLKCEAQPEAFSADSFKFYFSIGRTEADCQEKLLQPWGAKQLVQPNFARRGLARDDDAKWNFFKAVDEKSQTFTVCLGMIPLM
jgi:hypothetical protein